MAPRGNLLTISYQGFSCMLEGFEDPLRTMTAIIDYLRYLDAIAGEGGAGAAAPDPDILTRIAAGGIEDSVEVQVCADGILLRAVPVKVATDRPGAAPDTDQGCDSRSPEASLERLDTVPGSALGDLSRIFAEIDMQLEIPASSRRRTAIQHARAALAATRTPDRMSGLLRLGPDTRVDPPQAKAGPPEAIPNDFATFVARTGIAGLPDLVEMAAAYLTEIEGVTRLSRPMLMRKLDEIGTHEAREDVLRACDLLLDKKAWRSASGAREPTRDTAGYRRVPTVRAFRRR